MSDRIYNVLFLCTGNSARSLRLLRNSIGAFISLPLASIDRMALNSRLEGIGEMDGTTTRSSKAA